MARSIWNGVISFGMVSIPVKLFSATESKDIAFNTLHSVCNSRLKELRWCPVCEREVPLDEVQKGYKFAKDQYVVMTDEDFEKVPLPSRHTIQVDSFVNLSEIDPIFYDKTYYLEPDEAAAKPYALFMRTLTEKGMTAVATIAVRKKEQLCSLRAVGGTLVLETLFYEDEVRIKTDAELPKAEVSEQELKMAETLVDLLTAKFEPDKYNDKSREALMGVIQAKLEGQELVAVPAAPEMQVIDIMAALKASVEAAKSEKQEQAAG